MKSVLLATVALLGFSVPYAANATLIIQRHVDQRPASQPSVTATTAAVRLDHRVLRRRRFQHSAASPRAARDHADVTHARPLATTLTSRTIVAGDSDTTLTRRIASSVLAISSGGTVDGAVHRNNCSVAGTGPFILSASSPVGTLTHTFTGSGSESDGPTVLAAFNSDAAHFDLTFAAPQAPSRSRRCHD